MLVAIAHADLSAPRMRRTQRPGSANNGAATRDLTERGRDTHVRLVSRRAHRIRARLAATVTPLASSRGLFVCQTRDVSNVGCFLDTATPIELGTRVAIAIFDRSRGTPIELVGEIQRVTGGNNPGVGVQFRDPPDEWRNLVGALSRMTTPGENKAIRRLRVLVVGDEKRQRGALALYVTSGWDVRFATSVDTTIEGLTGTVVDAVIAEHDASDPRWRTILSETLALQPSARRIVRGALDGAVPGPPLVHRFVDRDAGLEALLDALTADLGASSRF
jgi:hypothetical protein